MTQQQSEQEQESNNIDDPFISDQPVTKTIQGGKFKFRELTGSQHDEMQSRNIQVENGNVVGMNLKAKHQYLLTRSVVDAPDNFTVNGTHYKDLEVEDKKKLWDKVKPGLREQILEAANQVNGFSEEEQGK